MRIILEHTEDISPDGDDDNIRVELSHDSDYLRADVFFDMVARACIAYGWSPEAVAARINTDKLESVDISLNYPKMP